MHKPVSDNVNLKEKVEYILLPSVKVNIKEWLQNTERVMEEYS